MPVDLIEIAPNVFSHQRELALGFGFRLSARMTIIRRGDALWVHSPLPDDGWYAAAEALGEVRWLVAPSCFHHLHIGPAAAHFRNASVGAPMRLRKKRPDLSIDIDLDGPLSADVWPTDIESIGIRGADRVAEHLFYDAESRSLLVTDLVFNNEPGVNLVTRIILALFAPPGGPARSKEWHLLIRDRPAFLKSLERLSDLALDRIIPAHGEIMEDVDAAVAVMRTGRRPEGSNAT